MLSDRRICTIPILVLFKEYYDIIMHVSKKYSPIDLGNDLASIFL